MTHHIAHKPISFGLAYESDRSYILWLPEKIADVTAMQAYRYNTFTRAWTRWDKAATCGLVSPSDDKMYIGYNENEEMFLEIAQCPRIYVGMELRSNYMDTNSYEDLGKLVDIQYREDSGFLFIFQIK